MVWGTSLCPYLAIWTSLLFLGSDLFQGVLPISGLVLFFRFKTFSFFHFSDLLVYLVFSLFQKCHRFPRWSFTSLKVSLLFSFTCSFLILIEFSQLYPLMLLDFLKMLSAYNFNLLWFSAPRLLWDNALRSCKCSFFIVGKSCFMDSTMSHISGDAYWFSFPPRSVVLFVYPSPHFHVHPCSFALCVWSSLLDKLQNYCSLLRCDDRICVRKYPYFRKQMLFVGMKYLDAWNIFLNSERGRENVDIAKC